MPFEFTGETPSLGSTSDAFKPLSFGAGSAATPPQPLSFGVPASSGCSTVSRPSSFANAFASAASLQTTLPTSNSFTSVDEDAKKASQNALAKLSSHNDSLSRALHRANLARPAIIGDSEVAADKLIAGYLEAEGRGSSLDKLASELADSSPEILRFLRHVFDHATNHKDTQTAKLESPRSPTQHSAEEELNQAPDFFPDIELGSPLYRACGTEISNIIHPGSFYHYNSYKTIAKGVSDLIAAGATRTEMRQFFASGANGRFTPSGNPVKDVNKLVDKLYEGVMHVKREFKTGWSVKGKQDKSYFCKTLEDEKKLRPGQQTWFMKESKEQKDISPYCCEPPSSKAREKTTSQDVVDEKPFRFLDLPPELRNHIYRCLLVPDSLPL